MQIWCTRHFLALCIYWVRGAQKGIGLRRSWDRSGLSSRVRRPPLFMCRIYLVAYKFRFDFILWREPSASCAFVVVPRDKHRSSRIVASPPQATCLIFRSHAHGDFHSQQPKTDPVQFPPTAGLAPSHAYTSPRTLANRSPAQRKEGHTISLPSRTEKSRKPSSQAN